MKNLKKKIRINNLKKAIICGVIIVILLGILFAMKIDPSLLYEDECIVETVDDIDKCTNKYVKVKTSTVYDTEYLLTVDGESKGHFVDIDLDGRSLIAIVKIDKAKDLFKDGDKVITGKLEAFKKGALKDGYDEIVKKYVDDFSEQASEEEIKSAFMPVQLNAYNASKYKILIPFVVIMLPLALAVLMFINYIVKALFVRTKTRKNIDLALLEQELNNGPYLYNKNNFILTNNFAIYLQSGKISAALISELVWLYERNVTQLGSSVKKRYLVLCFDNNLKWRIKFLNEDAEKVIQLLNYKKPNLKAGYSKETLKAWKNHTLKK